MSEGLLDHAEERNETSQRKRAILSRTRLRMKSLGLIGAEPDHGAHSEERLRTTGSYGSLYSELEGMTADETMLTRPHRITRLVEKYMASLYCEKDVGAHLKMILARKEDLYKRKLPEEEG